MWLKHIHFVSINDIFKTWALISSGFFSNIIGSRSIFSFGILSVKLKDF